MSYVVYIFNHLSSNVPTHWLIYCRTMPRRVPVRRCPVAPPTLPRVPRGAAQSEHSVRLLLRNAVSEAVDISRAPRLTNTL